VKMKLAVVLFVVVLCGIAYARPDEKYTTKYDNVDLDEIIKNDRLMRNYVDCLLGTKKCTKDGEELKKVLPEALKTDCVKCSEGQRNGAKKIIRHLIKNKRDWWNELEAKYDSDGTYRKQYDAELKRDGIVL
ncbi:hypothetical protein NQ314_018575, partial [Rhamnusium bicolor]